MCDIPSHSGSGVLARHVTLDGLRGFAVMGILAMNIVAFALPEMAYLQSAQGRVASDAETISWFVSFVLFDGKMRGLFSLLFGASMLLIIERANAKEENPAALHFRRLGWLALFGLAHFYFVWWGDILFLYAVVGCIAYIFRHLDSGRLFVAALMIYAIGFCLISLFMGSILTLELAAQAPQPDPETVKAYQEMLAEFNSASKELAVYRSHYLDILRYRMGEKADEPISAVLMNIWETLPYMMIGMALFKNGFLTGTWESARYAKWALLGLGAGATGYVVFGLFAISRNFDLLLMMNISIAWTYPFRLMMTLGYAAAFILLIGAFGKSRFIHRVAAAGRVAFTNYLGTSLVMTTIFYGYGFGLFGEVGRPALWLYVAGAWAIMLIWSKPWLTRFHYGPFEWLWRCLARWAWQPMRKRKN
jgi:uncharacterized protein